MPGELLESGAHSITVWFTQPEESGGSPVTGYKVQLQMEPDLELEQGQAAVARGPLDSQNSELAAEFVHHEPSRLRRHRRGRRHHG